MADSQRLSIASFVSEHPLAVATLNAASLARGNVNRVTNELGESIIAEPLTTSTWSR